MSKIFERFVGSIYPSKDKALAQVQSERNRDSSEARVDKTVSLLSKINDLMINEKFRYLEKDKKKKELMKQLTYLEKEIYKLLVSRLHDFEISILDYNIKQTDLQHRYEDFRSQMRKKLKKILNNSRETFDDITVSDSEGWTFFKFLARHSKSGADLEPESVTTNNNERFAIGHKYYISLENIQLMKEYEKWWSDRSQKIPDLASFRVNCMDNKLLFFKQIVDDLCELLLEIIVDCENKNKTKSNSKQCDPSASFKIPSNFLKLETSTENIVVYLRDGRLQKIIDDKLKEFMTRFNDTNTDYIIKIGNGFDLIGSGHSTSDHWFKSWLPNARIGCSYKQLVSRLISRQLVIDKYAPRKDVRFFPYANIDAIKKIDELYFWATQQKPKVILDHLTKISAKLLERI